MKNVVIKKAPRQPSVPEEREINARDILEGKVPDQLKTIFRSWLGKSEPTLRKCREFLNAQPRHRDIKIPNYNKLAA